ncbi:Tmemb_40 domain-containing protein [Cephalotus follicularis]|uniref:Tmemb_40 domain-containing protein n=1 Tax=Cephalotus follicularis TaxID=3775 RepID=A0A1Q3BPS4_CEPFO|nr:Tmemb_40 domain-containing protein [Cephalotus follicularis]
MLTNRTEPANTSSLLRLPAKTNGQDQSSVRCHGVFQDVVLAVPSVLFVLYLAVHAKKNIEKLYNGRPYILISYYALLWLAASLNLAWCTLQAWQCSTRKEVAWNLLSLFTTSTMLCLEISLMSFLLQENYARGFEALPRTLIVSGIIVSVDLLLKAIYVFGFAIPLFIDSLGSTHRVKWGLLATHKLLLTAAYGFILFVHFSKWREKLPPRPAFYNYVIAMFVIYAVALFSCGLASFGAGFGIWLYSLTLLCYHSLYLPFLYLTFLPDFFQEEDLILDNAYYSEMRDAGFFDADWD